MVALVLVLHYLEERDYIDLQHVSSGGQANAAFHVRLFQKSPVDNRVGVWTVSRHSYGRQQDTASRHGPDWDQMWLLPFTFDDQLSLDHQARFVAKFVDASVREGWAEFGKAIEEDDLGVRPIIPWHCLACGCPVS